MTETSTESSIYMHQATSPQIETESSLNVTKRKLPEKLKFLETLSWNFFWSWNSDATEVFRDLDPEMWESCEQNPREMLAKVHDLRLWQKAVEPDFIDKIERIKQKFDQYISELPKTFGEITAENPVAYFCAEYGVHNSLPIYSGGLGILAGDHLKSASDMNMPLIAIGLLYSFGYFRQKIGHDGWQQENYHDVFDYQRALSPVLTADGDRVLINVDIAGRSVSAQIWLARVGRISLFLLDTDVPQNYQIDRLITGHLYGGDSETRVVQEKVLGIGGVHLLRKLDITPSVYHLNEGHSAFLTLELARECIAGDEQLTFDGAISQVREKCVFTTHTPVAAGNDNFPPELIEEYFDDSFLESLKLNRHDFLALGRTKPEDSAEWFGMTPLAIRMARSANGVSEKHGEVSRDLWLKMFPDITATKDVPIAHVTNGVHPPTWIASPFKRLFEKYVGSNWSEVINNPTEWTNAVNSIPAEEIWQTHQSLKSLLVAFVRERTLRRNTGHYETINERVDTDKLFDEKVLTIGFARRVAAYKRWNLIMSDLPRLLRIVDSAERPVQFVFAGKGHPQDRKAKKILQNLMSINHESNWQHRAVFIEDYDQEVARYLVQGVDVWMNVPRRPLEASGTSGQKVAMNGGLNFSVLDGWWIEGFNDVNGFAIGGLNDVAEDDHTNDESDAEALYTVLENMIIPDYYELDESGLPAKWISRMRNAIATLTPQFSSDRMVKDYFEQIYTRN